MLRTYLQKIVIWYRAKNHWWLPLVAGFFYSICHPPFNHDTHPALFLFPLTSFIVIIPLFVFSLEHHIKKALIKTYLFGITASLTQFYWIANVMVEGLWPIIMLGLVLLTLFIALMYMLYGVLFRYIKKRFGIFYIPIFAVVWIIIEFARTLGDISFPWALSGYALTPLLPLAQLASVTGVYGLSLLVVLGNIILLELLNAVYRNFSVRSKLIQLGIFCLFLVLISVWGGFRLYRYNGFNKIIRISLIQNNIDQAKWNGRVSLDSSMIINEQLVYHAAKDNPDLIIFPESGVYCYLERQRRRRIQVLHWSNSVNIPMILGTLHFEKESNNPYYKHRVYNSVFFLDIGKTDFERYFKIKLVPFSEALPFEGAFPIISRLNLGESDFHRGDEEMFFSVSDKYHPAPFVCYEIIYPDFVRRRVIAGADLLVNLTNDGWFGHSTAPFHHAAMARMRSIENGVSLARCANSGISMLVDPVGRIIGKTGLYERTVLTGDVPHYTINTLYRKFGDWIIWVSFFIVMIAFIYIVIRKFKGDESL